MPFPDLEAQPQRTLCANRLASAADRDAFYRTAFFKDWLARIEPMVEGESTRRQLDGLEAWFRDPKGPMPPRWKMALLTWIAASCLAVLPLAAIAQSFAGSLVLPPGGIRWGQDTIQYTRTGTCSGTTVDFRRNTLVFGPLDSYPDLVLQDGTDAAAVGSGNHPATAP